MRRVVLLLLLLSGVPGWLSGVTVTVAYENREQPPYYMQNSETVPHRLPGVAVEMIKLLEQYIPGLKVRLVRYPWKRCLFALEHNSVDGIFNASYLPERWKYGRYPAAGNRTGAAADPRFRITTIAYHLYVPRTAPGFWNGVRFVLKPSVTGVMRGYSITALLQAAGLFYEEHSSNRAMLEKLAAGRLQAAALQRVTGDSLLQRNPALARAVRRVDPPLKIKPYYLMLSHDFVRRHPQLARRIWAALARIRETRFRLLAARY